MSFRVSLTSGSGHDDLDLEGDGEPDIHAFDSEVERLAFMAGVRIAASLTDGFVNAWVAVEPVEEEPEPNAPGYDEARDLLSTLADVYTPETTCTMIQEYLDATPPGGNRFTPLVQAARDLRDDPAVSKVLLMLKEALLNGS